MARKFSVLCDGNEIVPVTADSFFYDHDRVLKFVRFVVDEDGETIELDVAAFPAERWRQVNEETPGV